MRVPLVIWIFVREQGAGAKRRQQPKAGPQGEGNARVTPAHKAAVYMQIHEDRPGWRTSTELMYRMYCMPILQEQKSVTQQSWKKTISRGTRE
jgi:hypothetical protein